MYAIVSAYGTVDVVAQKEDSQFIDPIAIVELPLNFVMPDRKAISYDPETEELEFLDVSVSDIISEDHSEIADMFRDVINEI